MARAKIKVIKDEKLNQWVELKYLNLQRKYLQSTIFFVLLNIFAFSVASSIVVLNLFALKNNEIPSTKPFFIAIAIISGLVAFLSALLSFFKFKVTANKAKNKIEKIAHELESYEAKDNAEYKSKDREHYLIAKVTAIYNEEDEQ